MNKTTPHVQINDTNTMKQPLSSDESSSDQPTLPPPPSSSSHNLIFEHGDFPWRDMTIRAPDGSTAYFADISRFTPNTPDIVLHAGGKDGPTVGVAHTGIARSITCGLGSDELAREWVEMKRGGGVMGGKKYRFERAGRRFALRFVKGGEGTGVAKVFSGHYQVVDEGTGAEVARYVGVSVPGRKKGTLMFAEGVSREMEVLVVLGVAAWREKVRRRRGANPGGGASAGG